MKTLITTYTFNPAAKQVTITGYPDLKLEQFLLITNVTSNVIIYNFASVPLGGSLSGSVLTLDYDTSAMSAGDALQIFADVDFMPSNASTTAYAASLIIKATAGILFAVTGYNSNTSDQFIQLFESATLPANGAVPKLIFKIPGGSNFSLDMSPHGRAFANGIVICNSTTGPTKTIGAADCWFDAQYK